MSLNTIFDIAGSGLVAETARLTTAAGNMSNANVVTGSPDDTYRPQYPVFKTVQEQAQQWMNDNISAGVEVSGYFQSTDDPIKRYDPNNPVADQDGYVYAPNVNSVAEMANIISASRAYEMNVSLLTTSKQLIQRTLQLGQ